MTYTLKMNITPKKDRGLLAERPRSLTQKTAVSQRKDRGLFWGATPQKVHQAPGMFPISSVVRYTVFQNML